MNDVELIKKHRKGIFRLCKYQKPKERLWIALRELPFFKGSNLIDIGSNSGIHSMVASRYCKSITALEKHPDHHKRAKRVKSYFAENIPEYDVSKVELCNKYCRDLKDFDRFDAVLACCVIYHLSDTDLQAVTNILKNSNKVIFQVRPNKGRGPNDLWKPEKSVKYLENLGFKVTYKPVSETHPIVLGEK